MAIAATARKQTWRTEPIHSTRKEFLLQDGNERHILGIPEVIPNPENEEPTLDLEKFVTDLNELAARDGAQVIG